MKPNPLADMSEAEITKLAQRVCEFVNKYPGHGLSGKNPSALVADYLRLAAKVVELEATPPTHVHRKAFDALGRILDTSHAQASELRGVDSRRTAAFAELLAKLDRAKAEVKHLEDWKETAIVVTRLAADERVAQLKPPTPRPMETARLKPLISGYWGFDNYNGVEFYDTAAEAETGASDAIDHYRDTCDPGWSDDVTHVCWGVVLGQATERVLDDKPPDGCDYLADYVLMSPPDKLPLPDTKGAE